MSFYMHLPSNGSHEYFPTNRISSFKTKIPKRISFKPQEYEVGLTEFTFVNTISSLECPEDYQIHYQRNGLQRVKFIIPNIGYTSVDHLLKGIEMAFHGENLSSDATFADIAEWRKDGPLALIERDYLTNRCSIKIVYLNSLLTISSKLSQILGFGLHTEFETGKHYAVQDPQLLSGMHNIFVYCDIIESQIVSNTLVPLLRMINISRKFGDVVTSTFKPYYLPLSRTEFDTISILLCNEFGELLYFMNGQATATLHFRKILK